MPRKNKPKTTTEKVELTSDKKTYEVFGGSNLIGHFVRVTEKVGKRSNHIFVDVSFWPTLRDSIDKACEEAKKLRSIKE